MYTGELSYKYTEYHVINLMQIVDDNDEQAGQELIREVSKFAPTISNLTWCHSKRG